MHAPPPPPPGWRRRLEQATLHCIGLPQRKRAARPGAHPARVMPRQGHQDSTAAAWHAGGQTAPQPSRVATWWVGVTHTAAWVVANVPVVSPYLGVAAALMVHVAAQLLRRHRDARACAVVRQAAQPHRATGAVPVWLPAEQLPRGEWGGRGGGNRTAKQIRGGHKLHSHPHPGCDLSKQKKLNDDAVKSHLCKTRSTASRPQTTRAGETGVPVQ